MFLLFRSVHKNFVEKLKIVVKNSEKLNCSYDKVSDDLNVEVNNSHKNKKGYLIIKVTESVFNMV